LSERENIKSVDKRDCIIRMGNFYICGAGIVATSIYTVIKKMYHVVPISFLVSERKGNPERIDGIPVMEFSAVQGKGTLEKYVVAVPEVHHKSIEDSLWSLGLRQSQLIFVDSRLENKLLEDYYREELGFATVLGVLKRDTGVEDKCICLKESVLVAQAKCHVDKPLCSELEFPGYIRPLQVGTVFTEKIISPMRDNEGENISFKNPNYCELTATYSLWKNHTARYKGLCHYRRIFDISEEQMQKLVIQNELEDVVDVILPYPTIHYPDISVQHMRYVKESDWEAMLQALREVAPEYYEAYVTELSKQKYFYNYNMLIARQEVFDDYCEFLFSILERTEELSIPNGNERADRYIGYLGENLTTIYFLKNRDEFKIAHAGKLMLM